MNPLVSARHLALSHRGRLLAKPVGFELGRGGILLVAGPNGAGKSTLARAVVGLHGEFSGALEIKSRPDSVQYLAQAGNLMFYIPLSLFDVIRTLSSVPVTRGQVLDQGLVSERELRIQWNTSSGGERQRALLTALFLSPAELVVLDEPLNHLDHRARERVLDLIRSRADSGECGIFLISHDPVVSLESHPKFQRMRLEGVSA